MADLTVDELREHVNTDLGDDALERLLLAARAAVVARAGALGARTEIAGGGQRFVSVARPIDTTESITVTEQTPYGSTVTTLAADDYLIRPGGMLLERLSTGTNARSRWYGYVSITYTPVDDEAIRKGVEIDLVKLDVTYAPLLTGQTIGAWTEQYANNSAWNAAAEREAILGRLDVGMGMVVV